MIVRRWFAATVAAVAFVVFSAVRSEAAAPGVVCSEAADQETEEAQAKGNELFHAGAYADAAQIFAASYAYDSGCVIEKQDPPGNDAAEYDEYKAGFASSDLADAHRRLGDLRSAITEDRRALEMLNLVVRYSQSAMRRKSALEKIGAIESVLGLHPAAAAAMPEPPASSPVPSGTGAGTSLPSSPPAQK